MGLTPGYNDDGDDGNGKCYYYSKVDTNDNDCVWDRNVVLTLNIIVTRLMVPTRQ